METIEVFCGVERSPSQEISPYFHINIQEKFEIESKARGEIIHVFGIIQIYHIEIEHRNPYVLKRHFRKFQLFDDDASG
jgi:hypothetical protein